jgi:hypothetical protein
LLAADLHAEMVAAEKVEVSWGEFLLALQWMLGLNPDALLHSLLSVTQGKTEPLDQYARRFKVLFRESKADEALAARHFVWNMTDEGRAAFGVKLAREFGAPGRPELME